MITLNDDLTTSYSPAPAGRTPAVVDSMREYLPPGPFDTGEALDAAFKKGRWWARAYLNPRSDKLVLIATGT